MLRHLGILVLIYLGVVAQTSLVLDELSGLGRPFLPAFLVVVIVASCEGTPAILWSALLGLVLDGLSVERLGIQLALASLVAFGLQLLRPLRGSRNLLSLVAMILTACVAWRMLSPMTLAVLNGRVVDPGVVFQAAVRDAVWTAAVGSVLILVTRGLFGSGSRARTSIPRTEAQAGWGMAAR